MTRKAAASTKKSTQAKKRPWLILWILLALIVLLPATGFSFAAIQESNDSFCGSCHSQPESTYLKRSTDAQPIDLASYHAPKETRCIDCHSGQGVVGRLRAEAMGASNAFRWFSGTAVQPAPLTKPIRDENCLKCHSKVTQNGYVPENQTLRDLGDSENGHWHLFLPRWQSLVSNAGTCVSCHIAHNTDGDVKILFLNEQTLETICNNCHQTLGED